DLRDRLARDRHRSARIDVTELMLRPNWGRPRARREQMVNSALRHPMVLLLAGSLVTTMLAWQWQNRQKRCEVRLQLVGDMSATVMRFVAFLKQERKRRTVTELGMATLPAVMPPDSSGARPDIPETARFEVDRCILGTQLEAYLVEGSKVPTQWD